MLDQDLNELELMDEYGFSAASIARDRALQYARKCQGTNTCLHIEQSVKAAAYANKFGVSERADQILEDAATVAENAKRRERSASLADWQKRMGENDGR